MGQVVRKKGCLNDIQAALLLFDSRLERKCLLFRLKSPTEGGHQEDAES